MKVDSWLKKVNVNFKAKESLIARKYKPSQQKQQRKKRCWPELLSWHDNFIRIMSHQNGREVSDFSRNCVLLNNYFISCFFGPMCKYLVNLLHKLDGNVQKPSVTEKQENR